MSRAEFAAATASRRARKCWYCGARDGNVTLRQSEGDARRSHFVCSSAECIASLDRRPWR